MAGKLTVSCLLLAFLLAIFLHVMYKPVEGFGSFGTLSNSSFGAEAFKDANKDASCDKKAIAEELSQALGLPTVPKKDPETAALEKAADVAKKAADVAKAAENAQKQADRVDEKKREAQKAVEAAVKNVAEAKKDKEEEIQSKNKFKDGCQKKLDDLCDSSGAPVDWKGEIRQAVHEELMFGGRTRDPTYAMADYAMDPVAQPPANADPTCGPPKPKDECSPGLKQGENYRKESSEYAKGQKAPMLPPNPWDSRDYIRKDQIPCWGCAIP